jgi:autotransporter-associated beta strand protein
MKFGMLLPRLCLLPLAAFASVSAFAQTTIEYASGTNDTSAYSTDAPNDPLTLSVLTGAAEQSGDISGAGSVIKAGAGSLTLSGSNSYSGGTTLQDGTLRIGTSSIEALGSGTLTISGGTLGNEPDDMAVISIDVAVTSNFSIDAQGVGGSVEIFGDVDLGATDRIITLTSEGLACFGGNISGQNFTFVTTAPTSQAMFCSDISNTFTGTVRVGTGITLELWKSGDMDDPPVIAISGDLVVDQGASVNLLIWDQFGPASKAEINGTLLGESTGTNAIQVLSGTGVITSDSGDTLSVGSGTFAGTITGNQAIIKAGPGTLALSGSNSHTGGTALTSGTLRAQNNHAMGEGDVTVSNGAVLWVEAGLALDIAPGKAITLDNDGVSTYRKDFAINEDYAHFGAITSSGSNATVAQLLSGTASGEVSVEATFADEPASPVSNDEYRISDVLSLAGMNGDTFVLQLSYTQDAYEAAVLAGLYTSETELVIGILEGESWISLGTGPFVEGAWNSSYTDLGTHGVDTVNNVVWVVAHHNSDFAVVPEPAVSTLLVCSVLAALARRRRI